MIFIWTFESQFPPSPPPPPRGQKNFAASRRFLDFSDNFRKSKFSRVKFFYRSKKYCLENLKNLSIKTLNVHRIGNLEKYFEIELDNGEKVYAKKIYDSRTPKLEENKVKQHFFGYLIDTKQVIDNKKVTLMDFQSFSNGINFMYILPFTSKKALFESTYFSTKIFTKQKYKKINCIFFGCSYGLCDNRNIFSKYTRHSWCNITNGFTRFDISSTLFFNRKYL